MASEPGFVLYLTPHQTAWVKTARSSACEGCSAKGSCTEKGEDMEVEAINEAGAKAGDRILLTFDTVPLLKATFLLYVFPTICLVVGAIAGQWLSGFVATDPSIVSVIAGFVFFAISVLFVRARGNRMAGKKDYTPRITRVLPPARMGGVARRDLHRVCPSSVDAGKR